MDAAGAEVLRQRIEQQDAVRRLAGAETESMRAWHSDDESAEIDDVGEGSGSGLKRWLEHHERSQHRADGVSAPKPVNANGGGAGALAQRIEQHVGMGGAPRGPAAVPTAPRPVVTRTPGRRVTDAGLHGASNSPGHVPWFVVAMAIFAAVIAASATAIVFVDRAQLGGTASVQPPPAVAPGPGTRVHLRALAAYNPYGTEDEHSADAPRATDGNPGTRWPTFTYYANGFQKPGTGLVLRTAQRVSLAQLSILTDTPGFQAQVRVSDFPDGGFTADSGWQTVRSSSATFSLRGKTGRYWLIWLRLPGNEGRAHLNEVRATT